MLKRALALTGLIAVAACSGSSTTVPSTTQIGGTTVNSSHGTMTATIDGSSWTAVVIQTASYTNGIMSIGGADSSNPIRAVALAIQSPAVGTFQFGSIPNVPNGIVTIGTAGPAQAWLAAGALVGGPGSITISTFSSTGASGTFTFTAIPSVNATGNKVVTNGTFNVTFF